MPNSGIVRGQPVARVKVQRSKELRAEMTPQEKMMWEQLRANRLRGLHFRRQQVIDGFLADFYCNLAGLVIELDGLIHQRQADYDQERDKAIAAHNLLVLRFTNDEIEHHLDQVLQRIAATCATRLAQPKSASGPQAPPSL
jgi:very-short-patch-repair endonuclease